MATQWSTHKLPLVPVVRWCLSLMLRMNPIRCECECECLMCLMFKEKEEGVGFIFFFSEK
jgi:hypothetical protein